MNEKAKKFKGKKWSVRVVGDEVRIRLKLKNGLMVTFFDSQENWKLRFDMMNELLEEELSK